MITIDEIKLIDIKIPFKQVFHSSQDRYPSKSTILLQIKTKEGHNTWSECVALETPSYLPETKEQAWKCLQSTLIPKILSKPFESAESASQFINTITPGHEMAKASLEMGIWALFALQEEVSLSEFLGGKKTEIPCGLAIGIQENTDALITTVQKAIENDYHSLKLKLSPSTAIATLTCIRKEFGKELSLTGDANCSYEKHKIEEIKNLDNFSLAY